MIYKYEDIKTYSSSFTDTHRDVPSRWNGLTYKKLNNFGMEHDLDHDFFIK